MENKEIKYPRGVEVIVGPFIINEKKEVLLCTSPKWKDVWMVCGGHVEPGETLENAVKRETKEELGVDIEIIDYLGVGEGFTSPPEFKRNAHMIFINFIAKLKTDTFNFNNEISECKWFTIDEALNSPKTKLSCRNAIENLQKWLLLNEA